MRIIDDKGRLFGKVNIIDLFFIIVLLSLCSVLYFSYKVKLSKLAVIRNQQELLRKGEEVVPIIVKGRFVKIEKDVLKKISVGDKEVYGDGKITSEILKLGQPVPFVYKFNIHGPNERILNIRTDFYEIPVTLKVYARVIRKKLYYNTDVEILEGRDLIFANSKYAAEIYEISVVENKP